MPEEKSPVSGQSCQSRDLACGGSAVLLWGLPMIALIVGANWRPGQLLLWIPAFLVMGVGCLANAARCGRLHCYITGPLFLLAALYVALSGFHLVPINSVFFWGPFVAIFVLARLVEIPLGRYRQRA